MFILYLFFNHLLFSLTYVLEWIVSSCSSWQWLVFKRKPGWQSKNSIKWALWPLQIHIRCTFLYRYPLTRQQSWHCYWCWLLLACYQGRTQCLGGRQSLEVTLYPLDESPQTAGASGWSSVWREDCWAQRRRGLCWVQTDLLSAAWIETQRLEV